MRTWLGIVVALTTGTAAAAPPATGKPDAVELDPMTVTGHPPPVPRLRRNPHYPMDARRLWLEGCVILRFTVRPDGKTDDFAVLDSKPVGVFERSVIGAVFKWRYDPAPQPRTVVEKFEFRNPSLATQPRYTVRHAVKTPVPGRGATRRYRLEMQMQGYRPPTCDERTTAPRQAARTARSKR